MALGGRTVAEWQSVMTQGEFERWIEFYMDQPFDDFHRFHRPAALISASMSGDIDKKLEWLQSVKHVDDQYSAADLATFAAFGVKPPKKE